MFLPQDQDSTRDPCQLKALSYKTRVNFLIAGKNEPMAWRHSASAPLCNLSSANLDRWNELPAGREAIIGLYWILSTEKSSYRGPSRPTRIPDHGRGFAPFRRDSQFGKTHSTIVRLQRIADRDCCPPCCSPGHLYLPYLRRSSECKAD